MKKDTNPHFAPYALLFFLSPIVAEVLFGSTPVSRIIHLIPQVLFYGLGVLLIRETARRYNLGWFSIVTFGLAFGVVEEALALQSVFNPKYFGLDISYGRYWGINWVWTLFIVGYHSFWSITIPIVLTELVFPGRADRAWINRIGYGTVGLLFLLMTGSFYFIFQEQSGFTAPLWSYLLAVLVVLVLTRLAFYSPRRTKQERLSALPPFVTGLATLLGGGGWLWLLSVMFQETPMMPAWLIISLGMLDAGLLGWLVIHYSLFNRKKHRFALAVSGLFASMLFGLNVLQAVDNQSDVIAHLCFMLLSTVLLMLLGKKIWTGAKDSGSDGG